MQPVTDDDLFAGNSTSDTNSSSGGSDKQSEENRKQQSGETRQLTTRQFRRIRHTQRFKFTFNRMVKDDLRRQFPMMFCNVINHANTELAKSFLGRHLLPDCDVLTDPIPMLAVPSLQLKGPCQYAEYMEVISVPLPDFTLTLLGGRVIRQFHEETSVVEMFFKLKTTRLVYSQCTAGKSIQADGEECGLSEVSQLVDFGVHIKSSFEMNSVGAVVKVTNTSSMLIPAFLSIPSMNGSIPINELMPYF